LWLRDITDDIKEPHLDFWGRPTPFHTALTGGICTPGWEPLI